MTTDPIARARELSDSVLFPGALEVDASDTVPIERLDRLADAGFYGLAGPDDFGGLGVPDMATALEIIEILASGCLTTTFVWIQHHGAVRALMEGPPQLRDAWFATDVQRRDPRSAPSRFVWPRSTPAPR